MPRTTAAKGKYSFPKSARILRPADFREVYDRGTRISGPYFAAFCLRRDDAESSRVGFTTPRALGKAVIRNRLRRRVREAVRLSLERLAPGWSVVFNPRRAALEAPFQELAREVDRIFLRCGS